jgi:hypothetical protein
MIAAIATWEGTQKREWNLNIRETCGSFADLGTRTVQLMLAEELSAFLPRSPVSRVEPCNSTHYA